MSYTLSKDAREGPVSVGSTESTMTCTRVVDTEVSVQSITFYRFFTLFLSPYPTAYHNIDFITLKSISILIICLSSFMCVDGPTVSSIKRGFDVSVARTSMRSESSIHSQSSSVIDCKSHFSCVRIPRLSIFLWLDVCLSVHGRFNIHIANHKFFWKRGISFDHGVSSGWPPEMQLRE